MLSRITEAIHTILSLWPSGSWIGSRNSAGNSVEKAKVLEFPSPYTTGQVERGKMLMREGAWHKTYDRLLEEKLKDMAQGVQR